MTATSDMSLQRRVLHFHTIFILRFVSMVGHSLRVKFLRESTFENQSILTYQFKCDAPFLVAIDVDIEKDTAPTYTVLIS